MGDVTTWVIAAIPPVLIALVWLCAARAQLFEKAGEAGWQSWVPVRGAIVFLRLGGFRAWWLLLALVPVLGWLALAVIAVVAAHRIGRALGHGAGMTVLAVLLPPVWLSIAGWGSSRYATEHPAVRRLRARVAARHGAAAEPDGPWPFGEPPSGARGDSGRRAPLPTGPAAVATGPLPGESTAGEVLPREVVRPSMRAVAPDRHVPTAWAPREGHPTALPGPAHPLVAPASAVRAPAAPAIPPRPPLPAPAREAAPAPRPTLVALPKRPPLPPRAEATLTVETMLNADTLERGVRFRLVLEGGETVELTRSVAIVGRDPSSDPRYPEAQLVRLRDGSRTLSKTHALIERREDGWIVVDLGSTNGVFVIDIDGSEYDTTPGAPARVPERLVLGNVELRVAGAA